MPSRTTSEFTLDPPDAERLANLNGPFDAHLRRIELRTGVEVASRGTVDRRGGVVPGPFDQAAEDVADVLVVVHHEESQMPVAAHEARLVNKRGNSLGVSDIHLKTGVAPGGPQGDGWEARACWLYAGRRSIGSVPDGLAPIV